MPLDDFAKLTDDNYHDWRMYMSAVLIRKGLLGVVDGTERHPGGTDGNKKVREFYAKQMTARAEIILHVSPSQLAHCSHDDPMTIWNTLATIHSARGRSTAITLCRELHRLQLERNETMSSYIARARHLAFRIKEAGVDVNDDDLILPITAGLPRSYDPFLISLDTLPDSEYHVEGIIGRLVNEYHRQNAAPRSSRETHTPTAAHNMPDEACAVTATTRPRRNISEITCYNCAQKGHYQINCPLRKPAAPPAKRRAPAETYAGVAEDSDSDEAF